MFTLDIFGLGNKINQIKSWWNRRQIARIESNNYRFYSNLYPMTPQHLEAEKHLAKDGIRAYKLTTNYGWGYTGCGLSVYNTQAHAIQAAYMNTYGISAAHNLFVGNVSPNDTVKSIH